MHTGQVQGGVAHAHEVTGLVARHVLRGKRRKRLEHRLVVLAHRVAADAVTGKIAALLQMLERTQTQIQVHAALHDAKKSLVGTRMRGIAALGPLARELHGTLHVGARCRVARALVQLHADVASQLHGDLHVVLGRPEHVATIVVGHDKAHAVIGKLNCIVMTKDLEAARIGKDGAVPVHEVVKSAQLVDQVLARAHAQVIGVGEHNLRAQRLDRLGGNALDVGLGSHGHEDGRLDIAVRRVQNARACVRLGILGHDVVFEEGLVHVLELLVDMHVRAVVSHTKTAREQNPRRLHSVSA